LSSRLKLHRAQEAHPVASLFPMLSTEELDELAADIAERGLLHAIVLDKDGLILDGRNRLEACNRAKVEPRFETYEGEDTVWYVLATNHRRDMPKGAKAMAAVKAKSFAAKEWWGQGVSLAQSIGVSEALVSKSTAVLEFAPELADQVIAAGSLDDGYRIARERKEPANRNAGRLTELRSRHRDLAVQVDACELTLAHALCCRGRRE
jgi:hypothetical protein